MEKKGYTLFPVNPNLEEYNGSKCYPDVDALPDEVSGMVINTKPEVTKKLLDKAIKNEIKHIWLQQGSADKETIELSKQSDANVISKQCVIMFADPAKGIHGFHKWVNKTFGMLPK